MLLVCHCPCSGYLSPHNQLPPKLNRFKQQETRNPTGQELREGLAEWCWLRVSHEVKVTDQFYSHLKTQLKEKERERPTKGSLFRLTHVVGRFNFLTGYWIESLNFSLHHVGLSKELLTSWCITTVRLPQSKWLGSEEGETEKKGERERGHFSFLFYSFFFFIQRSLLVIWNVSDSSLACGILNEQNWPVPCPL